MVEIISLFSLLGVFSLKPPDIRVASLLHGVIEAVLWHKVELQ